MNRDQILTLIEEWAKDAQDEFQEYVRKGEEKNWDEEYEDTLERKYSEGFADALSALLGTISAKEKNANDLESLKSWHIEQVKELAGEEGESETAQREFHLKAVATLEEVSK